MSIPVVGRSPIIHRRPGDGGRSLDGRDTVVSGQVPARPTDRRRTARRAAIATFLVALALTLGGVQALPARYLATSVVSFMARPQAMTSADTVRLLGEKYVVLATSATIMQTAGDVVRTPPDDLADATTAILDSGTGNLEVTVTRSTRSAAVDAANAVAEALVRRSQYDELVQAETTSPASAAQVEAAPARNLLRSAGALAAVLMAALAWTLVRGRPPVRSYGYGRRAVGYGAW